MERVNATKSPSETEHDGAAPKAHSTLAERVRVQEIQAFLTDVMKPMPEATRIKFAASIENIKGNLSNTNNARLNSLLNLGVGVLTLQKKDLETRNNSMFANVRTLLVGVRADVRFEEAIAQSHDYQTLSSKISDARKRFQTEMSSIHVPTQKLTPTNVTGARDVLAAASMAPKHIRQANDALKEAEIAEQKLQKYVKSFRNTYNK